jgi:UDP-N-acetylmuramate--alanine ligase
MTEATSLTIHAVLDGKPGRIHCVGVCGVGLAGVAALLRGRGFEVSGCDATAGRLAAWLGERGVEVAVGHAVDHVLPETLAVVRSAAVAESEPELQRARETGTPVFSRGAVLAALINGCRSVAIGGTHGKTTTSSFLAQILLRTGRGPSWCIGGETVLPDFYMGVSERGAGDILVVEADESDGSLALYEPDISVITNIEFDHMEHFSGPAALEACFCKVADQTRQTVIFCADDAGACRMGRGRGNACTFGFSADADLQATDWSSDGESQKFTLRMKGRAAVALALPVPGRHNALNALAATAAALVLGLEIGEIATALQGACLPQRRFQKIVQRPDLTVVSDYAHHPSEIAALIRTAAPRRRLAVFQPHRYTRTRQLAADFAPAFDGADEVILLPVYAASEKPLPGGRHWDLYARMRADAARHGYSYRLRLAQSFTQVQGYLPARLESGDVLLIVGAGDIEKLVPWARTTLGDAHSSCADTQRKECFAEDWRSGGALCGELRFDEPLAGKTTLKCGGGVDFWAQPAAEDELAAILTVARRHGVCVRVLGGGSNVLVGDLGVDGLALRLAPRGFGGVRACLLPDGGGELICGAAAPLARVLECMEARGWSGLEFLQGIPGTVGGALRMNAGAHGGEIGRAVAWMRGYAMDGKAFRLSGRDAGFSYRRCEALRDKIAVEAGLRVTAGVAAAIRERRRRYAEARAWMRGRRSAGSAFLNPAEESAGRCLERAGLRGARVGTASLSEKHANILVMESGASASDALALLAQARTAALDRFHVDLETEICVWERT